MAKRTVEPIFDGRTFNDFLFRPQYSSVLSRKDITDLSVRVCRGVTINVPLVSANMDTITRERMAKTMPLEGGVGVLDRSPLIPDQEAMVRYVKRQHSYVIEEPVTLHRRESIGKAQELMERHNISGVLLRESSQMNRLMGILTHRDILRAGNNNGAMAWDFATPFEKLIHAKPGITLEDAERLMLENKIQKLPLVDEHRKICGLITLRDIHLAKQKPYSVKDAKGRLVVGAAIGATKDYLERAEALVGAEVDFLVMDVAHAHSAVIWKAVSEFRAKFREFPLVVGNVATYEGAKYLADIGVDGIKVGIGPGKGCLTRYETNFGVPQIQAIREVYLACRNKIPIMADGGIERDGHIVLALFCGADTVMLGSMFAATEETPGEVIHKNGKQYKYYRGMTSPESVLGGLKDRVNAREALSTPAEGKEEIVEMRGSVVDIISRIAGHLRSAVSYAGGKNLAQARRNFLNHPELFIQLSEAAKKESFDR
ncbi:MAG: IMP dehydrogenase [Candidatus Yanofskybacteria bacterium]|nr:IMP dehydrogenase [Candidatus Yanofskybacteria bacterium]